MRLDRLAGWQAGRQAGSKAGRLVGWLVWWNLRSEASKAPWLPRPLGRVGWWGGRLVGWWVGGWMGVWVGG